MIANFVYRTKGLEKFKKAATEYAGVYKAILPDTGSTHIINVHLEKFKDGDHVMSARNSVTIWVAPDYDKYPLNFIGAAIGHELVHIKDYLNDNVDLRSNKMHLYESEREAYAWIINNASYFKFTPKQKLEILQISQKFNR